MKLRGVALRLQGPLQAWEGAAVGDDRGTLPFPTRSGVLGVVAACMGIRRGDTDRLLALATNTRVHVRVDSPGTPLVDDQTIQDNPSASSTRQTIQSKRTYLCDASFVAVVVPGDLTTVEQIAEAVRRPAFSPYLGRRTCVLSSPLLLAGEVVGSDPIDLFSSIEPGPTPLLERRGQLHDGTFDFYLDLEDHPHRLRRLRVRDELSGPLLRQFRERTVVHVRTSGARLDVPAPLDPWTTRDLY